VAKASVYYQIDTEQTRRDFKGVKRELGQIPGVLSVSLNRLNGRLAVDYDDSGVGVEQISRRLRKIGLDATPAGQEDHVM
jgi:copper chaperone CopZ